MLHADRVRIGSPVIVSTWLALAALITAACPRETCAQEGGGTEDRAPVPRSTSAVVQLQRAVTGAIARAERSVVAIAVLSNDDADRPLGVLDLGQPFFDPERLAVPESDPFSIDSMPGRFAAGVLIDDQGHVVTTYHALGDPRRHSYVVWVQGRASKVQKVSRSPRVLAGDPWTDLAILKIDPIGTPARLGSADRLAKGSFVVALGNPYAVARDGRPSAAWGIVSNLRRALAPRVTRGTRRPPRETLHHYGTLIQTDVRLELGTSGGALVDLDGNLVGLLTALAPLAGYQNGAGFAIPVDDTFRMTVEKLKKGRIPAFGFLGVQPEDLTARERQLIGQGVRVVRVVRGTAGAKAGLQVGDVVTHVNSRPLRTQHDLIREISRLPMATVAQLTVDRSGPTPAEHRVLELAVRLDKKPIDAILPPFESAAPKPWRGIAVDFATAMPRTVASTDLVLPDNRRSVAVVQVDADSPAWEAGIRPGTYITHVEGERVGTPADFRRAVANRRGAVRVTIVGQDRRPTRIAVPESTAPARR